MFLRRFKLFHRPMRFGTMLALAFLVGCTLSAVKQAFAGDPSGSKTGVATDLAGSTAGSPSVEELKSPPKSEPFAAKLADAVGQNRVAINTVWVLVTGFLVMFMQAGFALVETGFCRAKNAVHTMFMNFLVYAIGMTGYFICGFALHMGGVGAVANLGGTAPLTNEFTIGGWGLFGTKGWFLGGDTYDVGVFALFLFQMVFMDTACTIPTGAMAERWKFSAFCIYGFFMSMFLYPIFANWAWGGGWLAQIGSKLGLGHGYVDFAGSGVVHAVGGLCGLAGAMVLGPRLGKYNKDGSANAIPGHHLPMAFLGCFILAFGWFGFNPGSTLGAAGAGNLRIAIVATVTMLASAAGALVATIYTWVKQGKPDPTMAINGMLAGLVAITAPSGFVNARDAFIIGAVAGWLVCVAVAVIDKLHVDDPVGAIAVHGVCGLFGVLSVGLFADGTFGDGLNGVAGTVKGLFYGDAKQLLAQLVGMATVTIWAFGVSWVFFKVQDKVMGGIRVSPEVEMEGLDLPEVGALAYPGSPIGGAQNVPSQEILPAPQPSAVRKPALES
jgi:Amt family ammonium transporter